MSKERANMELLIEKATRGVYEIDQEDEEEIKELTRKFWFLK